MGMILPEIVLNNAGSFLDQAGICSTKEVRELRNSELDLNLSLLKTSLGKRAFIQGSKTLEQIRIRSQKYE